MQSNRPAGSRPSVHKIFQNFGFLTSGKTLGDAFGFLLFVVLSRSFGQEGVGQYSFAMALTGFFMVFADFGLQSYSIKELSRRTNSFPRFLGLIFALRLILSTLVFGGLLLVLRFLSSTSETRLIVLLIGVHQLTYTLMYGLATVFIAREVTHLAGALEASLRATSTILVTAVILAGGNLAMALAALPVMTFGHLVVAYYLVSRKYGRLKLLVPRQSLTGVVRGAIPYALASLLFQLYSRFDVVLLGLLLGAAAAGVYNAAYRVVWLLSFIPTFSAMALFPQASRLYVGSREELESLYHKSLNLMVLVGLPAAAGLWLIAPDLVELIFGPSFAESASVLRILVGVLMLWFLNRIMDIFLMSCDLQVDRTKSLGVAAGVNVLTNFLFISGLGVKGAAVAALISEATLAALFALHLRPALGWPRIGSRLAIGGLGAVAFCLVFSLLPSVPVMIVIPLSASIYGITLLLFRQTRRNEVRGVVSLLREEFRRLMKKRSDSFFAPRNSERL